MTLPCLSSSGPSPSDQLASQLTRLCLTASFWGGSFRRTAAHSPHAPPPRSVAEYFFQNPEPRIPSKSWSCPSPRSHPHLRNAIAPPPRSLECGSEVAWVGVLSPDNEGRV